MNNQNNNSEIKKEFLKETEPTRDDSIILPIKQEKEEKEVTLTVEKEVPETPDDGTVDEGTVEIILDWEDFINYYENDE